MEHRCAVFNEGIELSLHCRMFIRFLHCAMCHFRSRSMAGASMQCELGKLEEVLSLQGPKLEFLPKMWLRTRRRKCLALGDCKASLLGSKPIQTRTCQTTQSYGYFAAYYRVVREVGLSMHCFAHGFVSIDLHSNCCRRHPHRRPLLLHHRKRKRNG